MTLNTRNASCCIYTLFRAGFIIALVTILSACASSKKAPSPRNVAWYQNVIAYKDTLNTDHPDRIEQVLWVNDQARQLVQEQFSTGSRSRRIEKLANWLISPEGQGMTYDVEANLTPNQAIEQQLGNCLSFTILLVTLAKDIGITLAYNDVDLPTRWELEQESNLVFYRHINAKFVTPHITQVYDLAIQDYEPRFPQRTITEQHAVAHLHSNLGIQALKNGAQERMFHHLKLAASMAPHDANIWINLGAAYKRYQKLDLAEDSLKVAISLGDKNGLAASNLERLYRQQGKEKLATRFGKLAKKTRLSNPYLLYRSAQQHLNNSDIKSAYRSIRRAIKLHDSDPKFYELRSLVNMEKAKYAQAILDLDKAIKLSPSVDERKRYVARVKEIVEQVENDPQYQKKHRNGYDDLSYRVLFETGF